MNAAAARARRMYIALCVARGAETVRRRRAPALYIFMGFPFRKHIGSTRKSPKNHSSSGFFLAEREGFEPSVPLWGTHDFQSCALDQLSHLSAALFYLIEKCGVCQERFCGLCGIFYTAR